MDGKSKYKLLVVDDNRSNCELAQRLLEDCYDIEIAFGGEEAISKIYDFSPAVILLDIKMPRLTGDELVKMIKARRPEIYIIMASAHFSPEIEKECMEMGSYSFLGASFLFSSGSFFWSPSTVVSGQNLNMGHFSHPTARATGQIVMLFTSFHQALKTGRWF